MATTYPASEKQMVFLARLGWRPYTSEGQNCSGFITSREASALIELALEAGMDEPRRPAQPAAPAAERVAECGMYRQGERIFKVQQSKMSGKLYAKELKKIGGSRLSEVDEVVHFEFEYAPGAMAELTAADRMTLEEAKAFGIKYGICVWCGAHLKDAVSVALGMGPVCAKKMGT